MTLLWAARFRALYPASKTSDVHVDNSPRSLSALSAAATDGWRMH